MSSLLDSDTYLRQSHSARRYSSNYHTNHLLILLLLSRLIAACPCDPCCPGPASRFCPPHPAPSERLVSSTFARWHVCHLCHIATASRRRGPPPFRLRSEPRQRAAFRTESSGYTLAGVAPGRKPYCGDRTSCSPSHGHGPRHSAWEGCRTIHLDQELSLGGGSTALGIPRLLIVRPPSRPKSPVFLGPRKCRFWQKCRSG